MAVEFGAVGTAVGGLDAGVALTLPGGVVAGVTLFACISNRTGVNWAPPTDNTGLGTWTEAFDQGAIEVFTKEANGSETTVTFADPGSPNTVIGFAGYVTGADNADPIDVVGTLFSSTQDGTLGPITGIAPTSDDGAVFVFFYRFDDAGAFDVLTGDGLTWAEGVDAGHSGGNDARFGFDYAEWTGAAPTITDKTFTVVGDASAAVQGIMMSWNVAPPIPENGAFIVSVI